MQANAALKKKLMMKINHLTTRKQNVAYFTCASRETGTHSGYTRCQMKYFCLLNGNGEGRGVGYMLLSVKSQGRVCERMSRTKFEE